MDRFTEMACFARSVETGSFAKAGQILAMSPQMVGKQVAALESRLGARLLVRTTRRQGLTDVGRAFYARCVIVLREAEEAERVVEQLAHKVTGNLVIGAPLTFGTLRLSPFVRDFLEQHPDVSIKLVLSDRNVDIVAEGFDLVIRIGSLKDSSLMLRGVGKFTLAAFASPSYLSKRSEPLTPQHLASHECLIYNYFDRPPLDEWAFEKEGRIETVKVTGRLHVNDGRAAIEAALAGYGIVLQDVNVLRAYALSGELIQLLPSYVGPTRALNLVYPPNRQKTAKLRCFIDAFVHYFNTQHSTEALT